MLSYQAVNHEAGATASYRKYDQHGAVIRQPPYVCLGVASIHNMDQPGPVVRRLRRLLVLDPFIMQTSSPSVTAARRMQGLLLPNRNHKRAFQQ